LQSLFGFITYPMELGLVWLAVAVGHAGIGIILFTIFVRLLLSPLQITQLRNAKAMQRVQPMLAELKQKHGKDRQKMTEATMALYKEHKVNPAMGCLPTLVQFPILIGLFYGLIHLGASPLGYPHPNWAGSTCDGHTVSGWNSWYQACYAIKNGAGNAKEVFTLFHANFLWLSNGLGRPDPLYILPVLAGVTQWIQSRMMLTRSADPQQQMMNNLMNFMPLMIVFFATRYASGLSLYWVTSTVIGILIQYRITGLGLLPETLRGGFFQRGAGGLGGSRGGGGPRVPRPDSKPKLPGGGMATIPSGTARPLVSSDGDLTGQNGIADHGSGEGAPPRTASASARPRKRPNRARGGTRSGRRG